MDSISGRSTAGDVVLVTGGTGFLARWFIAQLLEQGWFVRTTVRDLGKADLVRAAIAEIVDPGERLTFVAADLLDDGGWSAAMAGCRYVLHPASPLGDRSSDPDGLIRPARDGAVRVLRHAVAAGVERVVMTSAANAASPTSYREPGLTDETLWTDPDAPGLDPYRRSKTVAERAAWDFMAGQDTQTTLTTILPGAVLGPILGTDNLGSVRVIGNLLRGTMTRVPNIKLEVVDVRDIAEIHIRAMTSPAAGGERFLATGETITMSAMAELLRHELGEEAAKVPTKGVPDFVVRRLARRRPELRGIVPGLGRRNVHTTAKARELLGWEPRPAATVVVDCARSLIDHGVG